MTANASVLVTIITIESMEEPLGAELLALGATGYTAWTVRGRGVHGARPSTWAGANIRIEAAVSEDIAATIVERMQQKITAAVPLMIMTTNTNVYRR